MWQRPKRRPCFSRSHYIIKGHKPQYQGIQMFSQLTALGGSYQMGYCYLRHCTLWTHAFSLLDASWELVVMQRAGVRGINCAGTVSARLTGSHFCLCTYLCCVCFPQRFISPVVQRGKYRGFDSNHEAWSSTGQCWPFSFLWGWKCLYLGCPVP